MSETSEEYRPWLPRPREPSTESAGTIESVAQWLKLRLLT